MKQRFTWIENIYYIKNSTPFIQKNTQELTSNANMLQDMK